MVSSNSAIDAIPLTTPKGGTGVSTLTANGILVGAGSSSIVALSPATNGQVLMGVTSNNPAFTGSPSFSGSVTAATSITASSGNITATNGNLVLSTAGNKLSIATGTNASVGVTANMVAGSVTVTSTAVTTSSVILYARNVVGGELTGAVKISAQANGSFTLASESPTETSTFNYIVIN